MYIYISVCIDTYVYIYIYIFAYIYIYIYIIQLLSYHNASVVVLPVVITLQKIAVYSETTNEDHVLWR